VTYVITDACIDVMDRSCVEQCPVDCIQQGQRMLYINPSECIDCGACEPACPQGAIFADYNLPEPLGNFQAVNAEFYTSVDFGPAVPGSERAAAADHPAVAALPR
jgi:NAD-dependent dihydropyrimidine dehydrogenase PreA subunit